MATLSRLPSICSECGTTYERDRDGSTCESCRPADRGERELYRGSRQSRGYDERWTRLSRRARALQPFCSDCGATDDLTADHSTTAWERRAAGKAIRLRDIDVVCRRCNGERGAARGVTATDEHRPSATELARLVAEQLDGDELDPEQLDGRARKGRGGGERDSPPGPSGRGRISDTPPESDH